ncbi:MAG: PrsW family intramembrane metalloprotease [Candidatus Bathyarchaeota archaeon]|nr:PrsW family intramembrane metalloprotease [Candidatus Bathyarchaeota archaeon]
MLRDDELTIRAHRPSLTEKLFFFISGTLTSVPLTLFVGTFTDQLCVVLPIFYASLCSIVILAPLVEEFAKAYPLFFRHGETERSIFALGFLVGLGFGISEFLVYILALEAPVLMRLPGILFHGTSTSITAYGIAKKRPVLFYLIAAFLHFINNLSALLDPFWYIGGLVAIATTYSLSWRLYHKTSERFIDQQT